MFTQPEGWMRAAFDKHPTIRPGQVVGWASWPLAEALKHLVVFEPSKGMEAVTSSQPEPKLEKVKAGKADGAGLWLSGLMSSQCLPS
jgi:hypothetical protein